MEKRPITPYPPILIDTVTENSKSRMKAPVEDSLRSSPAQARSGEKRSGHNKMSVVNTMVDSRPTSKSARKRKNLSNGTLFRTMAAVLAALSVCRTLFYGRTVSMNYRSATTKSNIEYNFDLVPSFSARTKPESLLYPQQFQQLQKNFAISPPATNLWLTLEEKLKIRHDFRYHNRKSIYSLLLLPQYEDKDAGGIAEKLTTNIDAVMQWGANFQYIFEHAHKRHNQGLYEFHDLWGIGMKEKRAIKHRQDPEIIHAAWDNGAQKPRLIHEYNLCHAFRHARDIAGFKTPHVLMTHLNENWGTLSSEVPKRTHGWGDILKQWEGAREGECDPMKVLKEYLDSPYTLAVITTQHQALFNHPKVFSLPIGVANSQNGANALLNRLLRQQQQWQKQGENEPEGSSLSKVERLHLRKQGDANQHEASGVDSSLSKVGDGKSKSKLSDPRPRLLMINSSPTPTREPQMNAVIRNFEESGHPQGKGIQNMYETYEGSYEEQRDHYYADISSSKFILCPSGIGWDTYRIWESIILGAIPVIERHKYTYGLITYPLSSSKSTKLIHLPGEKTKESEKLSHHLRKHNGTLETVEYFDGWQKSLDDLPVVWIDGEFGDKPPKQGERNRNYLTPQFLEEQYDALAARAGDFRYEKLTSLHWIQFVESFLLHNNGDEAKWHRALETLSSTFNDHTRKLRQLIRENYTNQTESSDEQQQQHHHQQQEKEKDSTGYLFGSRQPKILSWVLLLELKLAGLALIVIAVRRFDSNDNNTNKE